MRQYAIDNKCGKHQRYCCVECNDKFLEGKCICDCECSKDADMEGEQCNDCDNGIHWDNIKKIYVNYEEMGEN